MSNNFNSPKIVMQPHLGRHMKMNDKPSENMGGKLTIAKVIGVHHKKGTVDLQVIRSNDVIRSDENNEGKFGARISVSSAHFDTTLMTSSGVVEPILEGQLVILAFLDDRQNEPIILGSFHNTWEIGNSILTQKYPLRPERDIDHLREAHKYLRVSPSQFYHKIDGIGAVEMSHPSRSFMIIDPDFDDLIGDGHNQFDHNGLSEKDPYTGKVRSARTEEAVRPVKMLYVHRSAFTDDTTTWTKFFIDSTGATRFTRDTNDGTLSYMSVDENGSMKMRRQLDSNKHDEGHKATEIVLDDSGNIRINHHSGGYITIDENGIFNFQSVSSINMNAPGGVYANGTEITPHPTGG